MFLNYELRSLCSNKSNLTDDLSLIEVDPVRLWVDLCPTAVHFNSKIVLVHSDSEKVVFSPVSSPAVSNNPKFCPVFLPPSDNWNFMIGNRSQFELLKDAAFVRLKLLISINSARNWSSRINFSLYLFDTFHQTVFFDFPHWVSLLSPTISFVSWTFTCWRSAVHAFLDIWAWKLVWVFGLVSLASFLRNAVIFGKDIHSCWVSTVARSSCFAINQNLWR